MERNEGRINLDGIFYDENGSFIPLTANDGNMELELAHLRNTFMESEREYFEELLSYEEIRKAFKAYMQKSTSELFAIATKLQEKLEYGELETPEEKEQMKHMTPEERDAYHMKKLEQTEGLLCLLFAATRDKAKILELVRTHEESSSRSR